MQKINRRRVSARTSFLLENLEPRTLMSTYVVNTTSDSLTPGPGLTSLRGAINEANSHGGSNTIEFSSLFNNAQTISLSGGFIAIYNTLNIIGPGSSKLTINAHSASRIFDVEDNALVTVSGTTFENGQAPFLSQTAEVGGAILNYGTSLTLTACNFSHNVVDSDNEIQTQDGEGGAIYSVGTLNISNTSFNSNSVDSNDAGTYANGGAIWSSGTLNIFDSSFTSNKATAGGTVMGGNGGTASGGAIYSSGKLNISGGSSFSGNKAFGGQGDNGGSASGGAIYSSNSDSIINSTITGNAAVGADPSMYGNNGGGFGGGIYTTSTLSVTNSKVTNNSATSGYDTFAFGAGTFDQQSAAGGGIFSKSTLTLTESTVSGNTAQGGNGSYGGIPGAGAQGGGVFVTGNLDVSDSSIFSNKAIGGVGNPANVGPNLVAGSGGVAQGGGVWAGGSSTFVNSTVAENLAQGGQGGDTNIDGAPPGTGAGAGGNAYGGGIFSNAAIYLYDDTIAGNAVAGGAGGAGDPSNSPPIPTGVYGNGFGGGLYSYNDSALADNTILSFNKNGFTGSDVAGKNLSSSSEYNLIGVGGGLSNGSHGNHVGITNPNFYSPLQNNGGPTETILPEAGSVPLKAGDVALIPAGITTDQRGDPRVVGGKVDIGAVET